MRTEPPELLVLSRERAEVYEPQGVEICISVTDPNFPEAALSNRFAAVLRLRFSDVLRRSEADDVLFCAEHADEIIHFLEAWPSAERVVVHCIGGVSRSPGIALGLCDRHGWPTDALERRYPLWNTLVRAVLAARPGTGT
jgi:predicted protein tyrosine phosphatase